MIKIESHKEQFISFFSNYPVFHLFIEYAIKYVDYIIYVDNVDNPQTLMMYAPPARIKNCSYSKRTSSKRNDTRSNYEQILPQC